MLHSPGWPLLQKYFTTGLNILLACVGTASLLFTIPYGAPYAAPWLLVSSSGDMILLFGIWELERIYFDCAAIIPWLVVISAVPLYRKQLKLWITTSTFWHLGIAVMAMVCFGISTDAILIFYQLLFGSFAVLCLLPLCYRNDRDYRWNLFEKIPWWVFPVVLFFVACLISTYTYEHLPFNMDSAAEIFTARTLQKGRVSVNPPPQECLDYFAHLGLFVHQGKWISQFPPGHAFTLAIGFLINAAWLIGPVSGALTACLCYRIGQICFDNSTAKTAVALFCSSPFVLLYSSEYLNHSTALLFFSVGLYGFVLWWKNNEASAAALSGFGIGYCAITRPLTALGVTLPLALLGIGTILLSRNLRVALQRIISGSCGLIVVVLFICLFCAYNFYTTGDVLTSGYVAHFGTGHNPGFGVAPNGAQHTIGKGIGSAIENIVLLNRHLFNLPFPSLLFIVTFFLLPNKRLIWDYIFLSLAISLILAYMTYWYHENFFGPRFMFELSLILCCLTARGIKSLETNLSKLLALPTIAVLLTYMIAITIQTDIVQRLRMWNESAAPISAILHFESEHSYQYSSNVYLIDGNYSSAVAFIDPELCSGPFILRDGENAVQCGKLLGSRIFRVDRNNVVIPINAGL